MGVIWVSDHQQSHTESTKWDRLFIFNEKISSLMNTLYSVAITYPVIVGLQSSALKFDVEKGDKKGVILPSYFRDQYGLGRKLH